MIRHTPRKASRWAFKKIYYPYLKSIVKKDLKKLKYVQIKNKIDFNKRFNIAYIRNEFWAKSNIAGGAVAHTKGIVEGFSKLGHNITVYSSFPLDFIQGTSINQIVIPPSILSNGFSELQEMEFNRKFNKTLIKDFTEKKYSFIYQRYGLNNYSGAFLSTVYNLPLILEYNGSEPWIARNWKTPLKYEPIAENIEIANFQAASLIIANAQALKDDLVARQIDSNKIIVIPNGVDDKRFNPNINGINIRIKYNIPDNAILVGFIGTFGKWHGAEVLAQAIDKVIFNNPLLFFIFIGDGPNLSLVKNILQKHISNKQIIFTGVIPQLETPTFIAACNILVSPQIPNPDGTPFFGSPTKLFEYMAMGKSIIASNLDQIGQILENDITARLVKPGDIDALANEIIFLSKEPEIRYRLGQNAYQSVISKYTWEKHIYQIINKMKKLN